MEIGRRAREFVFDALVLVLLIASQLEIALSFDDVDPLLRAAAVLGSLPLLARRVYPLAAPLVAMVGLALTAAIDPQTSYDSGSFFFMAVLVAWAVGSLEDLRRALAGLACIWGLSIYVNLRFPETGVADYFWVGGVLTGVFGVSAALTRRAQQAREAEARATELARGRAEDARRAVAEERRRIARELHDVVAHSISVMTVQAGGVRRLLRADQEREREALLAVEETGREALAEMRRLLGMLRGANETPALAPQPSLRNLEALLAQVREAGLPCELLVEGDPVDLPPGVDLSAYRIVQEALTNALRYAGPARARVRVNYGAGDVGIEVSNDGRAGPGDDGAGHGIAGMRERVAVFGGTLQSGPLDDGSGYVVRARLPLSEPVAAP